MKIRDSFVTNSSSSSFIVWFDKVPESVDEMQKMLYGNREVIELYGTKYSTRRLANIVFQDMRSQNPDHPSPDFINDIFNIDEIFSSSDFNLINGYDGGERRDKIANILINEWLSEVAENGGKIFRFHYADENGGDEVALEHGNTFDNFRHYRISYH